VALRSCFVAILTRKNTAQVAESGGVFMSKKGGKKDKNPKKPPMANKGPKKK